MSEQAVPHLANNPALWALRTCTPQSSSAVSSSLDLSVRTLPGDHIRPLQQVRGVRGRKQAPLASRTMRPAQPPSVIPRC